MLLTRQAYFLQQLSASDVAQAFHLQPLEPSDGHAVHRGPCHHR
jgi:hypothetical protein